MKIFMTGGTGFVGAYLSQELARQGHTLTILTRRTQPPSPAPPGISYLTGNPTQDGPWMAVVPEHDWIINLAGASIFERWTEAKKKEIFESRVRTTRNLVTSLAAGDRRQFLCSTSAVGFYGPRGEEELTEDSPPQDGFLGELARLWEGGGALGQMAPMFRRFLGGPLGSGRQWFSWIHRQDHARAYDFILAHPEITGPVNFTAPHPVRNEDLTKALARVLHRPAVFKAPAFMLRLMLGEFAETLLTGQKVFPKRLLDAGFKFKFPLIETALKDLLSQGAKGGKGEEENTGT
jgi:NAD dependent epimerase/dehydratase family enzyme